MEHEKLGCKMIFTLPLCFLLLIYENFAILPGLITKAVRNKRIKDLEFVEAIKHDLKQNNDDYIEIMRRSGVQNKSKTTPRVNTTSKLNVTDSAVVYRMNLTTVFNNKVQTFQFTASTSRTREHVMIKKKTEKEDIRNKLVDNIRRRVNKAFVSRELSSKTRDDTPQRRAGAIASPQLNNTKITPINDQHDRSFRKGLKNINDNDRAIHNQYRLMTKNKNNLFTLFTFSKVPTQTTRTKFKPVTPHERDPFKRKRNRMEKFKRFMEKNKGLLKDFISSKMAGQSELGAAPHKLGLRQNNTQPTIMTTLSDIKKLLQQAMGNLRGKKSMEELPDAVLLDMAPAKGGRIHQKRLRGRLCHRHVLVPEGPKYDSRGRVYLPPHARAGRRAYNATRAPLLLLPRCCNCCKKSVLGCA